MRTFLTALLLLLSYPAFSASLTLTPAKDNTVIETQTLALSNGAGPFMFAGRTLMQMDGEQFRRGLLQFDLSAIPAGSTINDVTLNLHVVSFRANATAELHLAESDWGESTSNSGTPGGQGAPAEQGDATWLHAFLGGATWNNVGGDFSSTVSAATSYNSTGPISFNAAGLVNDVQNWLDGISPNYGWFIIGNEATSGTAVRFGSRENDAAALRPQLVIDFTPPPIMVQFNPAKDNSLYDTVDGGLSNGVGTSLYLGRTGNNGGNRLRRSVMQFDLSSIPSDAVVESVSLAVTLTAASNQASNFDGSLHMLLADWGEGTSNGGGSGAASTTNDATWLHRFYDTTSWNTAGGDFTAQASASSQFTTSNNETVTFDSTTDLVADVQTWVQNPSNNYGWILLGDEVTSPNARGIGSRESGTPPVLTIEYNLPDLIFDNGFE